MSELTEKYRLIAEKISSIGSSFTKPVTETIRYSEFSEEDGDKVAFFQEELKKLESCLDRVQFFRGIAEKHIISLNTLPIVPREVDMTRIKTWSDRINIYSDDDPYAARLYVLCKSNELYLDKKIKQVTDILTALGYPPASAENAILQNHEKEIAEACRKLLESDEFESFVKLLYPEDNSRYRFRKDENNQLTAVNEEEEDKEEEDEAESSAEEPDETEEPETEDTQTDEQTEDVSESVLPEETSAEADESSHSETDIQSEADTLKEELPTGFTKAADLNDSGT